MSDSNSPSPAKGRDGFHAVLLLGVVVLALVLGYRPGTPETGPITDPALAKAGEVSSLAERAAPGTIYAAPDGPAIGPYDLNRAMALAGEQVPSGVESYYFFAFVDEVPAEQEIGDLAEKLQQAAKERDFLGISGPDSDRNRRNLLAALKANEGKDLKGVVIIYVGPSSHREELDKAVQAAGATLRFVVYPSETLVNKPVV